MEQKTLHIEGTVENVLFKNDSNGYIVLELDAGGELITVVGELGDVEDGEGLILEGYYITHQKFGTQFHAEYCERKLPDNVINIEKYLSAGAIHGIGPSLAKRIVDVFGDKTLEIMEHQPIKLSQVKGISEKKCEEIAAETKKLFSLRCIMSYLSQYGVKSRFAMLAYRKFGDGAFDMIKSNPYLLCGDSIELDFPKADSIAREHQIENNSPKRIIAGIQYLLSINASGGHTCLPLDKLEEKSKAILGITEKDFYSAFNDALDDNELCQFIKNEREYIFLPDYFYAENFIADRIKVLHDFTSPHDYDCNALIDDEETKNGIKYETLQRDAITSAVSKGLMILTGGPGTGKTTTLNAIISIFEKKGFNVLLAAPTGRAAKRMSDLTGYEAKTIHRLLEVEFDNSGRLKFKHNESNPLKCDVIVVDEMSMVDVLLFESLLRAVRIGCKIILVGDSDQLPSVGAGNLLKDIIDSGLIPVIELKEIFRQAKKSCIVTNAHKIVAGEYPDLSQKSNDFFFFKRNDYNDAVRLIVDLAKTRLPKAYKYSSFDDIQILTPSRKGTLGSVELNKVLQNEINPPSPMKPETKSPLFTFRLGDKIMQTKNNYDIVWHKGDEQGTGIFNGDIGRITAINKSASEVCLDFDGRNTVYSFELMAQVELAYAITVHKSQGCEFEAVIMPIMGGFEKLYYRNLLYTAVTRAKKLLILIGSQEKIYSMVDNNRRTRRYTCLRQMLQGDGADNTVQNFNTQNIF
ncbi:MAG: ATP-dependent RecD-like DNA helicase [Ruminococcus sp.]|jgi:exodeoxyribonuclease V alpha subunit|nr:ATP-dependent RecD-like DNA helicase [Ruminococcus sp.]